MKLRFEWRAFIQQSVALALFLFVQWVTNIWTDKLLRPRTLDGMVLPIIGFGLINLAIMLAGDRLARRFDQSGRTAYVILGAIAATVMHVVALAPDAYVTTAARGELTLLIAIPALLGASTGFLLHRTLGYAHEGDDPQKLANALAEVRSDLKEVAHRAFSATDSAEYYGGPLQVRDSSMAALVAAMIGSTLFIFIQAIAEWQRPFVTQIVSHDAFGGAGALFLAGIIGVTVPMYAFVQKTHSYLQARGKWEVTSYVKGGLAIPGLICLGLLALMGPFAVMVVLPWVFPGMAAMAVYHRLAGWEPLALPDDIEVRDPRTLIAADHPRRQMHRIVAGSSFGRAEKQTPTEDAPTS